MSALHRDASAYSRLVSLGWLAAQPGAGYWSGLARRTSAPWRVRSWSYARLNAAWLLYPDIFAGHSIPIKSGCSWPPER